MPNKFQSEEQNLMRSWDRYPCEHLDTYLVTDIEDPRINCQSILSRALIADSLWPNEFTNLIDAELRFGIVLTWLLGQLKNGVNRYDLIDSIGNDKGHSCPGVVRETYLWLQSDACPITDYISITLGDCDPDKPEQLLCERAIDTFCEIWDIALQGRHSERMRILEPACGSANDYRFIDRCGLSKFISYTGFDISEKNITNARIRFPKTDFRVASILSSGFVDESFDYLFVHDLFEHLSLEALNQALVEVMRLIRHQAWLHLFNAKDCIDHTIQSIDMYHWNLLSISRLCSTIQELGGRVEVVSVPSLLKKKFGCCDNFNPGAYTLLVTKSR